MKKVKILAIALLVLIAGTFFVTNESVFKAEIAEDAKIQKGVYIGGIDVSDMTAEEATDAVKAYVKDLKKKSITLVGPKDNLVLTLGDMGLKANTNAAVQEAVSIGRSGNLIKRFKALQDLEKADYVVDMGLSIDKQEVAQTLYNKSDKINIETIDNGLKRENGKFVYVPGKEGNEVQIVESVNALAEEIASEWAVAAVEDAEFTLTSKKSQPRGTEEQLSVVKDLLGTYTTYYGPLGTGRTKNVENGARLISGSVLLPGDELSVNEKTSPFTEANGWAYAGSYLNGETVQALGGGVCQVSTTLYNAVLLAELEITQRFSHSMTVGYVPLSADAAIAGTYKDLRFKNNTENPIYIEAVCSNANITFNVYGVETRDSNREVSYESETIETKDPDTEYTLSSSHKLGTFTQTRSEHVGYVAKLWKIVKIDGKEVEKKQVNKSTYNASCRKVTIGTKGATKEQLATIKKALKTKDDKHIESVVKSIKKSSSSDKKNEKDEKDDSDVETDAEPDNSTDNDTGNEDNDTSDTGNDTGNTDDNSDSGEGSDEGENDESSDSQEGTSDSEAPGNDGETGETPNE